MVLRLLQRDVKNWEYKGLAWLFMGAANSDAKLYGREPYTLCFVNLTSSAACRRLSIILWHPKPVVL